MKKRVLLISVSFMSLYKDIKKELQNQGYDVVYLEDCDPSNNYFDIHEKKRSSIEKKIQSWRNKIYWKKQIQNHHIDYRFDYLLVIDGFSLINSGLFEFLENINPCIKKILYLFDRTYKNYMFNLMFKSFDKIYSFDIKDCSIYHINLLPIYWVPTDENEKKIDIFGFGTYMPNRLVLFNYIENLTKDTHLITYIKLYLQEYPKTLFFRIRKIIKGGWFPDDIYNSPLVTHKKLPPSEYRRLLSKSRIVLDSHDILQDGLTARFMWALGLGAKIITTNEAVKKYAFYDDKQIAVFDVNNPSISIDFLMSDYKMDKNKRHIVDQYRIDNWVKILLS